MNTDTLTPDLLAAADDMAEWAVQHAAEAGLHPSLPTVAEALLTQDCDRKLSQWHASRPGAILHASEAAEAAMKARWGRESVAAIQCRIDADRQHQLSAALESLRALKGSA